MHALLDFQGRPCSEMRGNVQLLRTLCQSPVTL